MKTYLLTITLVSILVLTTGSTTIHQKGSGAVKLSTEQMMVINGQGCTFFEWLATLAAAASCGTAWACFLADGLSMDCITELLGGSGGGGTNGCTNPCPNGGYEEQYSLCQQIGGQNMGASQCASDPQVICCQD